MPPNTPNAPTTPPLHSERRIASGLASSSAIPARATPPKRSVHEIALSAGKVQLCDGHEQRKKQKGLDRPGFEGTHMPELQDWYKERIGTTTSKRKNQNASSLHMGRCIYKCDVFRAKGFCMLSQNMDDGFVIGECGIIHTQVCFEGAEKRFFQEDYEKSMGNVRAEEDKSAAGRELVSIEGCDIGRPDLDDAAAFAAGDYGDGEDDAAGDVVRKANQRLNQATTWFNCMTDEAPGSFYLTPGEVLTARRVLRAVCVRWARRGCDVANASSPVFWAIGIALEMIARRRDGFTVPTPYMQSIVSVEGLWRYLEPRKSDAFWTDESDFNKTRAWIHTRDQMGMRDAVRATQQAKRRYARLDALGSPMAQSQKLACLSQLLGQSGFFQGAERTTLHPSILSLRPATIRAPPPNQPATTNLGVKWAMERGSFGLNALCKGLPRSKVPTSATASDTSSDLGDDEAEDEAEAEAGGDDDDMAEPAPEAQPQPEPEAQPQPEPEAQPQPEPEAAADAEAAAESEASDEDEDDEFDSGDEADEAAVGDIGGEVSDDTDSEDDEPDLQRAFRAGVDAEEDAPDCTFDRKRRNYDRSEWPKLTQRQALASANFDRNPKWIVEWRAAVKAANLQAAAVDAERQAKLDRRKERRMRRQRRAIESRLIEQARQEDAPFVAAARAERRAEHKAQKRAERAERKQQRVQEASRDRAERRVEEVNSINALALSVAKNEDVANEATGHIPKLKLQVARKGSGGVTHSGVNFKTTMVAWERGKKGDTFVDRRLAGSRGAGTIGDKDNWGGQRNRRVGVKMKGMRPHGLELRGGFCFAKPYLKTW